MLSCQPSKNFNLVNTINDDDDDDDDNENIVIKHVGSLVRLAGWQSWLRCFISSDNFLNLSLSQFSNMQNENNNSTLLAKLLYKMYKMLRILCRIQ